MGAANEFASHRAAAHEEELQAEVRAAIKWFSLFFSKSLRLCVLYIIRYRKKRPNGEPRKRLRSVFRKKCGKNLEYIVIFSKFAADNSK